MSDITSRIQHVVVLMLENRSFDHLMGYFPNPEVEGLNKAADSYCLLNPDQPESDQNPRFPVGKNAAYIITPGDGPGHSLKATNYQLYCTANGPDESHPLKNNGYVLNYNNVLKGDNIDNPTNDMLGQVMLAFTPDQLPAINALASEFVLCDHWFSEVPGPTQPNRLYMHAATSQGLAYNDWGRVFDFRTIYNSLEDAGKNWAVYYSDDNDVAKYSQVVAKAYTEASEQDEWTQDQQNGAKGAFFDYKTFFVQHARAGTLPAYTFIEPAFGDAGQPESEINSMHAPHDVRPGDRLVAEIYEALRSNEEAWSKTLFIVTFDEHGGFFDHVLPPSAVNPDGINGEASQRSPAFAFDRLGLRVPTILASPWLPKGQLAKKTYQHTSILKTLKNIFGLSASLTQRDDQASAFDDLLLTLHVPRQDCPTSLSTTSGPEPVSESSFSHASSRRPDELLNGKAAGWYQILAKEMPDAIQDHGVPQSMQDAHHFMRHAVKTYSRRKARAQQSK
jgi:phospholipase C